MPPPAHPARPESGPPEPAELDAAGLDYLSAVSAKSAHDRAGQPVNERLNRARGRYLALLRRRANPSALHMVGRDGFRPEVGSDGIHRETIDPAQRS